MLPAYAQSLILHLANAIGFGMLLAFPVTGFADFVYGNLHGEHYSYVWLACSLVYTLVFTSRTGVNEEFSLFGGVRRIP